jgi:putative N6-adenine-specific DNA methylase
MYLFDHIKNHTIDPLLTDRARFYFIVPLGAEEYAAREIQTYCQSNDLSELKLGVGGIEVNLPLNLGLSLNKYLKIPTRILLRLAVFKARDFPKMFKTVSKLPWGKIFYDQQFAVQANVKQCRLIHTDRISETIEKAIAEYRRRNPPKKSPFKQVQQLWIRGEDDSWELSLDTSGEALYKRGMKKDIGMAPLRENLAAYLLEILESFKSSEKKYTLVDPMAGSGTFILEAATKYIPSTSREYGFEQTKLKNLSSDLGQKQGQLFEGYIGIEKNETVFKQLEENTSDLGITVELFQGEFSAYSDPLPKELICLINPPYGKRLALPKGGPGLYYKTLLTHLWESFQPELLGILIPRDVSIDFRQMKQIAKIPLLNGGIKLHFFVWMAKS